MLTAPSARKIAVKRQEMEIEKEVNRVEELLDNYIEVMSSSSKFKYVFSFSVHSDVERDLWIVVAKKLKHLLRKNKYKCTINPIRYDTNSGITVDDIQLVIRW